MSSAELRRNFGYWQQKAFQTPVTVVRHGKPRLVLAAANRFPEGAAPPPVDPLHSAIAAIPEHTFEGFVAFDSDLRIQAVNRVFEDLCGRSAAELVGREWAEIFPPADSVFTTHLRHVLRYGEAVQFQAPSTLVPGRLYACSAFPHPRGVAVLLANRTVEQGLREEIADARALEMAVQHLSGAAHLKINLRGVLLSSSPQFTRLTGYDPVLATHNIRFADLLQLRDRQRGADLLEEVLTDGRPVSMSTAVMTMSGTPLPVDMALAPVWREASITGAVGALSHAASAADAA